MKNKISITIVVIVGTIAGLYGIGTGWYGDHEKPQQVTQETFPSTALQLKVVTQQVSHNTGDTLRISLNPATRFT